MCDKIKDDDNKFNKLSSLNNDSCIKIENKNLDKCLKINNNNFAKCKDYINLLKLCYENKSSNKNKIKD